MVLSAVQNQKNHRGQLSKISNILAGVRFPNQNKHLLGNNWWETFKDVSL